MRAIVRPRLFTGTFRVPASKSHTIRRLFISALADGKSVLENPLDSLDARSCVSVCRAFGAEIEEVRLDAEQSSNANPIGSDGKQLARWIINGVGAGKLHNALRTPENVIDVGNSGTTLYLALALAALGEGGAVFTGDAQIRKRSAAPLLAALNSLGADAFSTRGDGAAPIVIRGPFKGGRAKMECPTSQYLSALLLAAPLRLPLWSAKSMYRF
ncbi:hypothetical protein MASR2M78_25300 [Treponema sp.]